MKFERNTYKNMTVHLDGNTFIACEFDNCKLEYSGGKVPSFVRCSLVNSGFTFSDQAGDTVMFLRQMYHGGFKKVVEETFKTIQTPLEHDEEE